MIGELARKKTAHIQKVFMRLFQSFINESVDSTSKMLVSVLMSASLSLKLKNHDISRAYFQGTMERLVYI